MTDNDKERSEPALIIHGGAGRAFKDPQRQPAVREALAQIVEAVYVELEAGSPAVEAAVLGCRLLEDCPHFNAGTGSVLQSDGQIRMSASLMDGARHSFSGIINVSRVQNPIAMVEHLQGEKDRIVSDAGAQELARELGIEVYDPIVERRLTEWLDERRRDFSREAADVVSGAPDHHGSGTIGVVVLDRQGRLAAGTSTGGRGFERIGRVSDTAMPAGNYASKVAAVSCTGIGEDIVDESLAVRLVVRAEDGMSLEEAFKRSFDEALGRGRRFGAIGLDASGFIVWGKTTELLLGAYRRGQKRGDLLAEETAPKVTGF
ncbi:MAG: isoaspartyl peptidase/L-asparaginase [Bradymonadaceae bacterium]